MKVRQYLGSPIKAEAGTSLETLRHLLRNSKETRLSTHEHVSKAPWGSNILEEWFMENYKPPMPSQVAALFPGACWLSGFSKNSFSLTVCILELLNRMGTWLNSLGLQVVASKTDFAGPLDRGPRCTLCMKRKPCRYSRTEV